MRTTAAVLGTAAVLALTGCATSTAGSGSVAADATRAAAGSPTSLSPPTGSGTPTPGPPPTTSAAPTSAAPTASGRTVTLNSVTVPLTGVAKATRDGDYLCLTLVNDTGCSLEVIDIGATRSGGGSVSTPAPGESAGWWWGSDVPSCGGPNDASAVTRSSVVEKGFKKVGPKTAQYGSWLVSCQNSDQDFAPRLWWLPSSQIAFREHSTVAGSGAAVDRILAGVTFSG